ncbi:MAG: ABC transporter substrate-binding protein [Cyanobacteria bacterium]|nr:ABC transporter substrate-binding protein [Cyanobacteriota bacterium]
MNLQNRLRVSSNQRWLLLPAMAITVCLSGCSGGSAPPTPGAPSASGTNEQAPIETASTSSGTIEYLQAKPLFESDVLKGVTMKPVKSGKLKVPTITWPGDVATIYTKMDGSFQKEGLDVELFCENDFAKQVKAVLEGETPYLRGTMGMVNSACETFAKSGINLVVVYQLTWSNGGDCMVVRPDVKSLPDLKGKKVALQLYGPHMDYLATVAERAGLKPSEINMKWLKELSIPTYDTKGKVVDPRSAFAAASDLDAAMVISPDANALSSGGKVGTGAEGSVKGAKILFTSKSANRVIADVYAVRSDYFKANKGNVEKFVRALSSGEEHFEDLLAAKAKSKDKYDKLISESAQLLFGSPQAAPDVEGSLGDCQWVGFQGNVTFFSGAGTTRSFNTLKNEIQTSFVDMGLMKAQAPLETAGWDYNKIAAGLKRAKTVEVERPKFDAAKVQRAVEGKIAQPNEEEGTLYKFEIYFGPKQANFPATQYQAAFKKALDLSQTFGGTLLTIEGHNSPDALNKAVSQNQSETQIALIKQAAKNLSYRRAQSVRQAYLDYCKKTKMKVDESQFVAVGVGTQEPKYPHPQNEKQWGENRRVVFRVKGVETELDSFKPES